MRKDSESVVYVVDDDEAICNGVASSLKSIGLTVRCFASAQSFLRCHRPDLPGCLVLDVRMPDTSGLDLQKVILKSAQPIPVIFITGYGDIRMAVEAMKEGAVEFLLKPFRDQDLLDAVSKGLTVDRAARSRRTTIRALSGRHDQLTGRERQVLIRLLNGRRNKQIATELRISEITVKAHRHRVMEKMGASSFAELVRMAECLRQNGTIDQGESS